MIRAGIDIWFNKKASRSVPKELEIAFLFIEISGSNLFIKLGWLFFSGELAIFLP